MTLNQKFLELHQRALRLSNEEHQLRQRAAELQIIPEWPTGSPLLGLPLPPSLTSSQTSPQTSELSGGWLEAQAQAVVVARAEGVTSSVSNLAGFTTPHHLLAPHSVGLGGHQSHVAFPRGAMLPPPVMTGSVAPLLVVPMSSSPSFPSPPGMVPLASLGPGHLSPGYYMLDPSNAHTQFAPPQQQVSHFSCPPSTPWPQPPSTYPMQQSGLSARPPPQLPAQPPPLAPSPMSSGSPNPPQYSSPTNSMIKLAAGVKTILFSRPSLSSQPQTESKSSWDADPGAGPGRGTGAKPVFGPGAGPVTGLTSNWDSDPGPGVGLGTGPKPSYSFGPGDGSTHQPDLDVNTPNLFAPTPRPKNISPPTISIPGDSPEASAVEDGGDGTAEGAEGGDGEDTPMPTPGGLVGDLGTPNLPLLPHPGDPGLDSPFPFSYCLPSPPSELFDATPTSLDPALLAALGGGFTPGTGTPVSGLGGYAGGFPVPLLAHLGATATVLDFRHVASEPDSLDASPLPGER